MLCFLVKKWSEKERGMELNFSVKEAVTKRYSVRTFDKKEVEKEVIDKILTYAKGLENPLGPKIRVQLIEKETAANGEKLGTYGIIKGAKLYLGVIVPKEEFAAEAVGYDNYEEPDVYRYTDKNKIKKNELFPAYAVIIS